MSKIYPFGWRVLVSVDNDNLENMGKDVLSGVIVQAPKVLPVFEKEGFEYTDVIYKQALDVFQNGVKVRFLNNAQLVDRVSEEIYNVPVELIRSYESEEVSPKKFLEEGF